MEKISDLHDDGVASGSRAERVSIVEEDLHVEKRELTTGTVTVHTVVDEEAVDLHAETTRETVEIVRVPKDTVVEVAPAIRQDGDTTIIPIIEERLVVVKRLVLTEEVHVRRVRTTEPLTLATSRRVMRPVIVRQTPDPVQPERTTND